MLDANKRMVYTLPTHFSIPKGDGLMHQFWQEFWPVLVPLAISAGLGTLIGAEREYGNKPAGLRTHVLVCLGSTMFVLTIKPAIDFLGGHSLDPTRLIHGVVTGVGFLGAGAIMRHDGYVHGLTTAASIWMVAAIGVAVGIQAHALAVAGTVMAFVVLVVYRKFERLMPKEDEKIR